MSTGVESFFGVLCWHLLILRYTGMKPTDCCLNTIYNFFIFMIIIIVTTTTITILSQFPSTFFKQLSISRGGRLLLNPD